jgi:hypothetical protein
MSDEPASALFAGLWRIYSEKAAGVGINLPVAIREWAARQRGWITEECGAGLEYDVLVRAGCSPTKLILFVALLGPHEFVILERPGARVSAEHREPAKKPGTLTHGRECLAHNCIRLEAALCSWNLRIPSVALMIAGIR